MKEFYLLTIKDHHAEDEYKLYTDPTAAIEAAKSEIFSMADSRSRGRNEVIGWTPTDPEWLFAAGFGEGYDVTVRVLKISG